MESENNAIVCLTRGYKDIDGYRSLIKRNKAIKKFINMELKYPLVIFHEGNIPSEHQKYIIDNSEDQELIFINIAEVWVGGYESMCRFQTYWLFEYTKQYDKIMRIDEDCWLVSVEKDPFDQMGDHVYLRTVYWDESHSETNATLPEKIEGLTGIHREVFYNRKYPYTNICVTRPSFWREEKLNKVLKEVALCDDQ